MIELFGHPFAAFTWKPLIAAYMREVPFTFRIVDPDNPENAAHLAELAPTGQMPALVDRDLELIESNAVIEYLDGVGNAPRLIPVQPEAALRARMLADVFDDYVATPMQRIVAESFRTEESKDPTGVDQARAVLERSYGWLSGRVGAAWAVARRLRLCFTRTGCRPSLKDRSANTELASFGSLRWRGSWTRHAHFATSSRLALPTETKALVGAQSLHPRYCPPRAGRTAPRHLRKSAPGAVSEQMYLGPVFRPR